MPGMKDVLKSTLTDTSVTLEKEMSDIGLLLGESQEWNDYAVYDALEVMYERYINFLNEVKNKVDLTIEIVDESIQKENKE